MAVLGLLGAFVATGCDKKVTLLVTNTLPRPVEDVSVSVAGEGTAHFGTIMPMDTARWSVKIPKDMLPARGSVQGRGFAGQFTIYEDTKSPLSIYLDPTGVSTVRKGDTVQKQQHIESKGVIQQDTTVVPPPPEGGRIIQQDTVVE
jgi:hypothetical protein